MEYALQLLLPIALALWLGSFLHLPPGWMVLLVVLGMVAGIAMLYRRVLLKYPPRDPRTIRRRLPPEADRPASADSLWQDLDDTLQDEPPRWP